MENHKADSHLGARSVCSLCKGTGWIWDYNITAEMDEKKVCYECDGKGYVEDDE